MSISYFCYTADGRVFELTDKAWVATDQTFTSAQMREIERRKTPRTVKRCPDCGVEHRCRREI